MGVPVDMETPAPDADNSSQRYNLVQKGDVSTGFTISGPDTGHPTILDVIGRKLLTTCFRK
jgi:hypothetical protein